MGFVFQDRVLDACLIFDAGLVRVFIELAYWVSVKYARAPDPLTRGEMAMARASSLASPWPGCTFRTVPSVHEVFFL